MRSCRHWLILIALLSPVTGCSLLSEGSTYIGLKRGAESKSSEGSGDSQSGVKVANPPARTIRFDGHEIVLGDAESKPLECMELVEMLQPLVAEQKQRSAVELIEHHRETAQRLIWERWAKSPSDSVLRLVAETLSQGLGDKQSNWSALLDLAAEQSELARTYLNSRNAFANQLKTADPSNEQATELQSLAQRLGHPLVKVDCLRLMGLRELVAQRNGWAESLCRQAVDAAESTGDDMLVADMGMMVAEAARRSQQTSIAVETWNLAVQRHVQAMAQPRAVQASFWVRADQTRPENAKWPEDLRSALSKPLVRLGCSSEGSVDMILWACVAQSQYECGAHQQALVNFKRAETHAKGSDQEWLRIAQSRCLASMGQVPAAAAILSGPMTSSEPAVVAAATAAMGSTKLQSGAYQQGAQLLNKALTQSAGLEWATKHQALADLALAQLIIGDTEPGLQALHSVQEQFAQAGERILLIHSLENELRLLEHESRADEAEAVKARIVELERI